MAPLLILHPALEAVLLRYAVFLWILFVSATFALAQQPGLLLVDWTVQKGLQISGARPVYPPLAVAAKIEGVVRLKFVVTADGTTKDVLTLSGHPLLTQSAIDAVRTWRFRPPSVRGIPMDLETIAPVDFFQPGHDAATVVAKYRRAVQKHPTDSTARDVYGRQLLSVGNVDEAIAEFEKAIALRPKATTPHFGLGDAHGSKGNIETAIQEYRLGIAIKPDDAEAHFRLAGWLLRNRDLDGAIAEQRLGLQIKPKGGRTSF